MTSIPLVLYRGRNSNIVMVMTETGYRGRRDVM